MTNTLKEAAYVTVGLGVLGFQKAQVRRVELTRQLEEGRKQLGSQFADATQTLEAQIAELTKLIKTLAADLDARIAPVRSVVEESLGSLEVRLPPQTRAFVEQARATAKETETQLRVRFGLAANAA
jgi:ElaB/YqjD/DUF883 family membrane-anchored ribosome-binding protein